MTTKSRLSLAALALAASIGGAGAQTTQNAQDHDAHHPANQAAPQAQAPAPTPGQRPMGAGPGGPGGGGMMTGGMMGGDMSQMMGMMQMMRGGMMPMGAGPMGMGPGGGQPFRHVEGQLAFFRTELRITDAQLPQWNALAEVIRGNTRQLQQVMMPPAPNAGPPSLPDQLERRAAQLAAMLEATKAVLGAAKPLYAVLSTDQKKTADELMAEHMMTMRMRGL